MVEKAYAKVHGSYLRTKSGWPQHAMTDLTGAPAFSFLSKKLTVEMLLEYFQKGYMMCAGVSRSNEEIEEKSDHGIANQHAYALLRVHTLKEQGITLVQMRNPWGHYEWKGDWSDKSELWTDELKEEVGLVVADDGCFWMSFEDY
jgi:calpain-15